jgi:hypothetical protein
VEKYFTAGQATDGNMARAHCMLDKDIHTRATWVIFVSALHALFSIQLHL